MRTTNKFVFFYGKDDHFSNFYPAKFIVDDIIFSCGEQYIMYSKAILFGDSVIAAMILQETKPTKMKALGRKVRNFDDDVWCANREELTFKGLFEKYNQNANLKKLILDTGNREIVEASPRDRVWGIGMGENNPDAEDKSKWKGRNILGKILMKVRDAFIE